VDCAPLVVRAGRDAALLPRTASVVVRLRLLDPAAAKRFLMVLRRPDPVFLLSLDAAAVPAIDVDVLPVASTADAVRVRRRPRR